MPTIERPIITRAAYMADPCHLVATPNRQQLAHTAHRAYYAPFVNAEMARIVANYIGPALLLKSKDPHFNDIPLERWSRIAGYITTWRHDWDKRGDYATLSGLVCIAKEAARQYVEANAPPILTESA